MKIYAISGLGADKRVFQYLTLNHDLITIDWITPEENEPIEKYAERLSVVIDTTEEFALIGVSFGGLIAVEISKIIQPRITFLISSVETKDELPKMFRWIGKSVLKYLPERFFDIPRKSAGFVFGTSNTVLLHQILDDTDLSFAKWAINQLVNWKNTERLKSVMKISGSNDKIIPASGGENEILIQDGAHFMIVDRAAEISEWINLKMESIAQV